VDGFTTDKGGFSIAFFLSPSPLVTLSRLWRVLVKGQSSLGHSSDAQWDGLCGVFITLLMPPVPLFTKAGHHDQIPIRLVIDFDIVFLHPFFDKSKLMFIRIDSQTRGQYPA